jgi:uracil-DNA glycosylase
MITWNTLLNNYFQTDKGKVLGANYKKAINTATISPIPSLTFKAYSETVCPFESVKVVLLYDEPNADPNIASGLAFGSRKEGHILPETKTLFNWMKKGCFPYIDAETFKAEYVNETLFNWAKQGILLLNVNLCVYSGRPGSCRNMGWQDFTSFIINNLSSIKAMENKPLLFVSLGDYTEGYLAGVIGDCHLKIHCQNPLLVKKDEYLTDRAKSLFIGMSNFVSENYPEQARDYPCSLEKAFNFDIVDQIWLDHVIKSRIPIPAMPEGIGKAMKEAVMNLANKFDCPGTAGIMLTPTINYKIGIDFSNVK